MRKLNFDFLSEVFVPKAKRTTTRLLWLRVLASEIKKNADAYCDEFNRLALEESYTAQTIALQDMLNDKIDPVERRIFIRHFQDLAIYFYKETEQSITYLYKESEAADVFVFRELEGGALAVDFEVVVTFSLGNLFPFFYKEGEPTTKYVHRESEESEAFYTRRETENRFINEITALVNKYKSAGFTFQIVESL